MRIRPIFRCRVHTNQGESRLEILASEQDPAKAELFDETDYRTHFSIPGQLTPSLILATHGTSGIDIPRFRVAPGTADA